MRRWTREWTRAVACGLCAALTVSSAACGQGAAGADVGAEKGQTAADAESTGNENGQAAADGAQADAGTDNAAAVDGIAYQVNTDISGLDDSHRISDTLFGLFLEDINYAVDGGMYAEKIGRASCRERVLRDV